MKEQVIAFETAKLAKEKGFDINIRGIYIDSKFFNKKLSTNWSYFKDDIFKDSYLAPTQSLLQKWLREEHEIDIEIKNLRKIDGGIRYAKYGYIVAIRTNKGFNPLSNRFYITYEEALEQGLQIALKLIK